MRERIEHIVRVAKNHWRQYWDSVKTRKYKSGTVECYTPKDVVVATIGSLTEYYRPKDTSFFDNSAIASFWVRRRSFTLRASDARLYLDKKSCLELDCRYPYREDPNELLKSKGVEVPEDWRYKGFKKRRRVFFSIYSRDATAVAMFLDRYFIEVLGYPDNYSIMGEINPDYMLA